MKPLLTYWSFDWILGSLLLIMIAGYTAIHSFKIQRCPFFIIALLLCVLCFFSPLQLLSAHYLFSFHMLVHVLLLLCVGPLLVLSLSPQQHLFSFLFRFLKNHPVISWLTGLAIMWFWHVPVVFNTVMATGHTNSFSFIAALEIVSLITAGILFSSPILHPNTHYRIDALSGVVYLFTACIGCSLLGLLITFAPTATYHHFLSRHDVYGLNSIIVNKWRITKDMDQQAAGLMMWVPCCLLYVTGVMYLLIQWFQQKEKIIVQLDQV